MKPTLVALLLLLLLAVTGIAYRVDATTDPAAVIATRAAAPMSMPARIKSVITYEVVSAALR
jgi:hypothetical protein